MKFVHLSDLHLGKQLEEYALIQDQAHIMEEILVHILAERPDGVLVAGDVFDRSVPPTQALALFQSFLSRLSQEKIPSFIISGNHDSPQRLAFGWELLQQAQVYISPAYQGTLQPITLEKEGEAVDLYLLPFLKPLHLRPFFPQEEINSYSQAVALALKEVSLHPDRRNILITHQFVTGAATCDSEELSVGGTDNVDASLFDGFDYVALGHLHSPQSVTSPHIRYCGSPLKYSASEVGQTKSLTVVELGETLEIRTLPLTPLRDVAQLKGDYQTLTQLDFYQELNREHFYQITLTDQDYVPEALARLRSIYPRILHLSYDNIRSRQESDLSALVSSPKLDPLALFAQLYQEQNGQPLSQEQTNYIQALIESIWEEESE